MSAHDDLPAALAQVTPALLNHLAQRIAPDFVVQPDNRPPDQPAARVENISSPLRFGVGLSRIFIPDRIRLKQAADHISSGSRPTFPASRATVSPCTMIENTTTT